MTVAESTAYILKFSLLLFLVLRISFVTKKNLNLAFPFPRMPRELAYLIVLPDKTLSKALLKPCTYVRCSINPLYHLSKSLI